MSFLLTSSPGDGAEVHSRQLGAEATMRAADDRLITTGTLFASSATYLLMLVTAALYFSARLQNSFTISTICLPQPGHFNQRHTEATKVCKPLGLLWFSSIFI